ncbi:uncharacterized protein CDAR_107061 [Caerostris darwini]|uniref:Uncharacterized protein n=1 Tax=Caerostris darwini TaxID=1538125 RepID=A0AAV4SV81_9ARAC|nr:uncharacterized protein CDAR_107061 [Caerostris darwini]
MNDANLKHNRNRHIIPSNNPLSVKPETPSNHCRNTGQQQRKRVGGEGWNNDNTSTAHREGRKTADKGKYQNLTENGVRTRGGCHVPHIWMGVALPPKNVCRQKWCWKKVDGWRQRDRMVETCGAIMHL